MSSTIDVNGSEVEHHSSNISNTASSVQSKSLNPIDKESTIAGNLKSQQAFKDSQSIIADLVSTINGEAQKIQKLGEEFVNVDNFLANMVKGIGK